MLRFWLVHAIARTALVASLGGCAFVPGGDSEAPVETGGNSKLTFQDVLVPGAFSRTGPAVADAPGGAAGFWAVVPGLPRPERARVENEATGARTVVALYAGSGGPGGAIRLSGAAAEAIGAGDGAIRVEVIALRREPRIAP